MKYVFLFVLVIGLAACDQKGTTDAAKERATAEGEAERDVQAKALAEKISHTISFCPPELCGQPSFID